MVDQGHKAVFKQSNVVLVLVTKISFKKLMNIYLIKKKEIEKYVQLLFNCGVMHFYDWKFAIQFYRLFTNE